MTERTRRPSSLRARLLLMSVAAAAYVAVLGAYALLELEPAAASLRARAGLLAAEYDSLGLHIRGLEAAFDAAARLSRLRALTPADRDTAVRLRAVVGRLAARSAGTRASTLLSNIPAEMRLALAATADLEANVAGVLLEALTDLAAGDVPSAAAWIARSDSSRAALLTRLGEAQRLGLSDLSERERVLGQGARRVAYGVALWVVLGAALVGLAQLVLHRRLYAPLGALERGLARVAEGDLEAHLSVPREDEIGRLAAHFNAMTAVLRAHPEVEALRREQFLVETLMEHVPDSIYFKDAASRFLRVNRAMAQRVGLSDPAHLVGRTDFDFYSREHAEAARKVEEEILRTGRPVLNLEERETWPDGRAAWVSTTKMPLRDETGAIVGTFGISRDVTERREAERLTRASETRFRTAFMTMADGHYIATRDEGRLVEVNDRFVDVFGYTRDEVAGRTSLELGLYVYPADRARMLQELRSSGQVRDLELMARRKSGETLPVQLSVSQIPGTDPPLIMGVVRDVSAQREAERLSRDSEARFRTAFMTGTDAYLIAGRDDGRMLEANDQLLAMFGYRRDEVIGRTSLELGLWADPSVRAQLLSRVKAEGRVRNFEMLGRRKNGETFPVLYSVSELPGDGPPLLMGVIRDVSEQRRADEALRSMEEQFRQAQRLEAVGRLAGGVAHDFNNIVQAISGYTELLLSDVPLNDPRRADLEEIRSASQRATSLTRQLLAFSRKQVLQPRVLDLNEVIQGLEKMLRRLIGEDIALTFTPGSDLGAVKADPGQIEQVILNLAVNARDAMPSGGRLTIETANADLDEAYAADHEGVAPGPYVMMAVSDTGVGMAPETQAHIFEPFFTTKDVGKGTGLGLAMVHGIIKQSDGHVAVYSEPGRGTTFKVYVPRTAQSPESPDLVSGPRSAGGRETVLIAEDDRAVREVVAASLEQRGYRILRAPDAGSALEQARRQAGGVDLLLTDIVMPGMTGRELAQALSVECPTLRVLFMSGYTDDAVVRHGVLEQGVPYIQKPFTIDALATKVREVLDRRS